MDIYHCHKHLLVMLLGCISSSFANALSVASTVAPMSMTAIAATMNIYVVFIEKFNNRCAYIR